MSTHYTEYRSTSFLEVSKWPKYIRTYFYNLAAQESGSDLPGCFSSTRDVDPGAANQFLCTRKFGHSGPHVAIGSGRNEVFAVWD
jgi:hypothetical protein